MAEHPKRPLKIYHCVKIFRKNKQRTDFHAFYTNKFNFTVDELKAAPIIRVAKESVLAGQHYVDLADGEKVEIYRPRLSFWRIRNRLRPKNMFPYPAVTYLDENWSATKLTHPGGEGIGQHFELIAYKYLRDYYGKDLRMIPDEYQSPQRLAMLAKIGITRVQNHTLDEHIKLFSDRIKQTEERLKRERGQ